MDDKLKIWMEELSRFNDKLHLMGPAMLKGIGKELEVLLPLLKSISEPVLADLGSGSGLPAIPYKLVYPESHLTLIERSAKKCTFLRHVADVMRITEIEILTSDPLRDDIGRFDAVMVRSFSPLSTLQEVCTRVLNTNGRLYYFFTGNAPDLSGAYQVKEILTQCSGEFCLNLAVFIYRP